MTCTNLVTVCMVCLLCATHATCFAHGEQPPEGIEDPSLTDHRLEQPKEIAKDPARLRFKKDTPKTSVSEISIKEDVYSAPLRDIDTSVYVKKLFAQFGDPSTMMMNLTGFEMLLRTLELEKMIIESLLNEASPAVADRQLLRNGSVVEPSSNINCINSVDLVTSVNAQIASLYPQTSLSEQADHGHRLNTTEKRQNMSLANLKNAIQLNSQTLMSLCPILLYQKVAPTSNERRGCVEDRNIRMLPNAYTADGLLPDGLDSESSFRRLVPATNRTHVWVYATLSILAISACGLLGVAVIPVMHRSFYNLLIQFLVALAVGTLSGDALLHLLPHAMTPHHHGHHDHRDQSNHDENVFIGLVAILGLIFLYFMEKGLTVLAEWRKHHQRLDKENKLPSRVRVMREDGSNEPLATTSGHKHSILPSGFNIFKSASHNCKHNHNHQQEETKICKHKYSEYPYCYDEIATDTKDDHHVRENSSPQRLHGNKHSNANPLLSVVSIKELPESGPNDLLLQTEDGELNPKILNNLRDSNNCHSKTRELENMVKNNRSQSVDRGTDMEDLNKEDKTDSTEKESYTVILREHSQRHHGHSHAHGHVHSPPSSLGSVAWMVVMGDGLHNFTDGMAIGAAFSSGIAGGFSTAIAVLCHELPHELGDFAVLLKAGMSARRAVCYNVLSSALCFFGMVVGVCAGHTPSATRWIFAAAAGMFLYIALVDMIPELSTSHSKEGTLCQCFLQLLGLLTGSGIMLLIAMYEHDLKNLFDT